MNYFLLNRRSLSISAIEKAIAKMVEEGRLEKMGSGKTTYYVVKL